MQNTQINKPIAVVSTSKIKALNWIRESYDSIIKQIDITRGRVTMNNGKVLVVVTDVSQCLGMEFSDYMIADDYNELLNMVKSRVR